MGTRARRNLGLVLLTVPIVTAVVLYLCGVRLFSARVQELSSSPDGGGLIGQFSFHWLSLVLALPVVVSLRLLFFHKHEWPAA